MVTYKPFNYLIFIYIPIYTYKLVLNSKSQSIFVYEKFDFLQIILCYFNIYLLKMQIFFYFSSIIFSIEFSLISFISLQLLSNFACSSSFNSNSTNSLTPFLFIIAGTPIYISSCPY